MKFYVMTLFPQMILDGLNTSITGRAIESGAHKACNYIHSVRSMEINIYVCSK